MIDEKGYRSNVGMILVNHKQQVFWGKRKGEDAWQFPQGGINNAEALEEAMFRELNEELGLLPQHVSIVAKTREWLYYDVPGAHNRNHKGHYRGQKQIWFLLKFLGHDYQVNVKLHQDNEFDAWRWVDYWLPIDEVVSFKQEVYDKVLHELFIHLNPTC